MRKIFVSLLLVIIAVAAIVLTPQAVNAQERTGFKWIATIKQGVTVIPYVRVDKKALIMDFEGFNNVEYVYYNVNYTQLNGVKGGVEGSFIPDKKMYTGSYKGQPYIRVVIPFGSCSRNVCSLSRVKDLKLTVNTKYKNGTHYSNVITVPADQL